MSSPLSLLFEARDKRVHPGTDDKVLVSWNGLMISALASAATALGEPRFLTAAQRAADFCLTTMRPDGSRLLFLRSGPRSPVRDLWVLDLSAGTERKLLSAEDLLAGSAEKLSDAEKARRERTRRQFLPNVPATKHTGKLTVLRYATQLFNDTHRQLVACLSLHHLRVLPDLDSQKDDPANDGEVGKDAQPVGEVTP